MTASHISLWLTTRLRHHLIWLGLFALPCHALILGDLAVSSRPSPNFTASLPFSDDKTVRLSALQTRIATDAEYAQWGIPMPNEVRQLRLRVVPASQTVGYVELYSSSPLPLGAFNLLIWASYSGQTILTQYPVELLDVPSLIKGKTLSASLTPSTPRKPSNTTTSAKSTPNVSAFSELTRVTPSSPSGQEIAENPTHVLPINASPATTPPRSSVVKETALKANPIAYKSQANEVATNSAKPAHSSDLADDRLQISGIVIAWALVLFLLGFLVGKRPNSFHKVLTPNVRNTHNIVTSKLNFAPLSPTHSVSAGATINKATPSSTPTQTGHQPSPLTTPAAAVETTQNTSFSDGKPLEVSIYEIAPMSGTSPQATKVMPTESRMPATALPTPRMMRAKSTKTPKIRSMANEQIDLAKIYLSMGDPGTAQMVLQQVMKEGTEADKAMASQLMQQMI